MAQPGAQPPPTQLPEQQSAAEVQGPATGRQGGGAQRPMVQVIEQQSAGVVQGG